MNHDTAVFYAAVETVVLVHNLPKTPFTSTKGHYTYECCKATPNETIVSSRDFCHFTCGQAVNYC